MDDPRGYNRAPYFFLSYAHTPKRGIQGDVDPDMWVWRLFRDLCDHILQMTAEPVGSPVGFIDRTTTVGEGWRERLAEALATCRVFVPLYSPRYFKSDMCGREWYAFSQRMALQTARSFGEVAPIVPALWVPVHPAQLPFTAAALQFNHSGFGADYAAEGFYGLIKLNYLRNEYERAVYQLAKRIVQVAEETTLAPGRRPSFDTLPSAFGASGEEQTLRIVIVSSQGEGAGDGDDRGGDKSGVPDWNPYEHARPLAELAAYLARNLDYRATVLSFDDVSPEDLLTGGSSSGPAVLLVDRGALLEPERRERLSALDSDVPPWVGAMVPGSAPEPGVRDEEDPGPPDLETVAPVMSRRSRAVSRAAVTGLATAEMFSEVFPKLAKAMSAQFATHAPSYPPTPPRRPSFHADGPEPAAGMRHEQEAHGDRRP
ncbi:TIR-like protein FxsC [Streptomyces sp. NPDC001868]|uniref:TIR-like protein FxsC n=1 Tax=Streptomyces sp. NPDC001868 TaxID=3154401 RepID=UPI00332DD738